MSEACLSMLAASVELGIPVALIVAYIRMVRARRWIIVVLGSLVPWLGFAAIVAVTYLVNPGPSNTFAFYTVWVMGFAAYLAALLMGLGLSLLRYPQSLWVRFLLSFALSACIFIGLGVRHG